MAALTLLPPALHLSLTPHADELPAAAANLMPFSIEYDGYAPIDSFMILRPAPPSDNVETSPSLVSAFRGRAMQSTPLCLPADYEAHIIQLSESASSSSAADPVEAAFEPAQVVKQSAPYRPAKQQRFSMDSDDDDADEENDDTESYTKQVEASASLQADSEKDSAAIAHSNTGNKTVLRRTAAIASNDLRIWGADGPIDTADDLYFKTVDEWLTTIGPLLHS